MSFCLWALDRAGGDAPFTDHSQLYNTIDSIPLGDVPWQSFNMTYCGEVPSENPPPWMQHQFDVWFRDPRLLILNQLANPDFKDNIDYSPKQVYNNFGRCEWSDFTTGDWSWKQAVFIFPHILFQLFLMFYDHRIY